MQEMIISLMNQYGYIAICLLIAIENIFPPIPSELILSFGGFITNNSQLSIVGVIVSATLGSLLGAIVLYYLGRILNKERLLRLVESKCGKLLRLKRENIEKADTWFDTKGNKTVFFCRFIPILRSLISIPAGMSEMPFLKFLIYTVLGSIIWNSILTVLGSITGEHWNTIVDVMHQYSIIVFFLLLLSCILFFFYKNHNQKKNKSI